MKPILNTVRTEVARALLEIEAVQFVPHQPITFKSGMLSPVYVDNRKLPFWPEQWRIVIEGFQQFITAHDLAYDVIAGIAAAGIPHSATLAYQLKTPSIFIRKQTKKHGTQRLIEGGEVAGRRVLLIEDLVTTGGSSLAGVAILREAGATVQNCLCITTYGFAEAQQAFDATGVRLHVLTPFIIIAEQALKQGYFGPAEHRLIADWLRDPHHWQRPEGE